MKPKIIPTTQQHLDIEDILSDVVILKDGSAVMILEVSALNFGLLSENEQEATIYAYAQLLNSLTFSIQIVIASKQKDISEYLKKIDAHLEKLDSPLLKDQMLKYRDFIKSVVRQGNVLDKKFYVSIPFSSLELGAGTALASLGPKHKGLPLPKATILERAITSLSPKRDHLVRLLSRIGLRTHQLSSRELTQLFYDFYNRSQMGIKISL